MNAKALIRIDFIGEKQLMTAFDALLPEVTKSVQSRSKLHLEKDGTFIVIKIEASDTTALRSALNAYLRWMDSIKDILLLMNNLEQNQLS